jgi:hypothetical protein
MSVIYGVGAHGTPLKLQMARVRFYTEIVFEDGQGAVCGLICLCIILKNCLVSPKLGSCYTVMNLKQIEIAWRAYNVNKNARNDVIKYLIKHRKYIKFEIRRPGRLYKMRLLILYFCIFTNNPYNEHLIKMIN